MHTCPWSGNINAAKQWSGKGVPGSAKHVFRMPISRCQGKISIDQEAYTKIILERFQISKSNTVATPLNHEQQACQNNATNGRWRGRTNKTSSVQGGRRMLEVSSAVYTLGVFPEPQETLGGSPNLLEEISMNYWRNSRQNPWKSHWKSEEISRKLLAKYPGNS